MVSHTRRTPDPRRIRRLKPPQEIEVRTGNDEAPVSVHLNGVWLDVIQVRRPWRIDQHWWRAEPVSRIYYRVASEDRSPLTLYYDLLAKKWARQEY